MGTLGTPDQPAGLPDTVWARGREQPGWLRAADEAWAEVLALSPDADTPGMRAQFVCHWQFAEFAQPGKTSWNLEPWRPVVDDAEMVASGCNPGGAGGTVLVPSPPTRAQLAALVDHTLLKPEAT